MRDVPTRVHALQGALRHLVGQTIPQGRRGAEVLVGQPLEPSVGEGEPVHEVAGLEIGQVVVNELVPSPTLIDDRLRPQPRNRTLRRLVLLLVNGLQRQGASSKKVRDRQPTNLLILGGLQQILEVLNRLLSRLQTGKRTVEHRLRLLTTERLVQQIEAGAAPRRINVALHSLSSLSGDPLLHIRANLARHQLHILTSRQTTIAHRLPQGRPHQRLRQRILNLAQVLHGKLLLLRIEAHQAVREVVVVHQGEIVFHA